MRFLNQGLAQEIVNRTMKIINRNINVMNEKGIIIGSGDKKRIDTIHEGAVRVIENKSGFEIEEAEAKLLHGVKAGINLPITFRDHVVGVIGITGAPDEIRNYGELVKMAAEMILQQAVLVEEMQWDERLKEELISQLLQGTDKLTPFYFERVERLGINLDIPRVVILLSVENQSNAYKYIQEKLEKDDLYVMHPDHIVLLKKVHIKEYEWDYSRTLHRLEKWMLGLKSQQQNRLKVVMGDYHAGLDGVSKSYQDAVDTSKVGEKLHPDKTIYFYQDYKLPVFLARANQLGIAEDIGPYFAQLQHHDKKGELLETLMSYVEENGDINKVAGRLFIHRNTLRYRLERITEITDKDPRKVKDLLELYLSILQHQVK
ncbi:sugar diacid recognition domain-containing protein [Neobacillus dielmonensis]|uniref:sugar diacid recognition domain-containing protein n=1 Tax=Neobacillus dielmonensis TaxID=1347369 RepID=UPI0005A9A11D|nr:sugar diacid recognition domain-containing protein [Neobacillus dielmonensis]